MSEHERFQSQVDVSVNTDYVNNTHSMRELTEKGLHLEKTSETIRKAGASIAEHYLAIAQGIESRVRAKRGTAFVAEGANGTYQYRTAGDDKETIRLALAEFRIEVNKEINYLKEEVGRESDKLPGPNHQAVRAIVNGWENGFALTQMASVSAVKKANAARTKEEDQELISKAKEDGVSTTNPDAPAVTGVQEVDNLLHQINEHAKSLAERDSKTCIQMLSTYAGKLHRAAEAAGGAAVAKAANDT